MYKLDLEKGKNRDQIANIHWITEKAKELKKKKCASLTTAKAFDYVNHNKLWKILKEMGIPDYLIYLLTNLYAGREATVRNRHVTTE